MLVTRVSWILRIAARLGLSLWVSPCVASVSASLACAQMKDRFARMFTVARQLGVAVSSGVEAAWHTVMNGIDWFVAHADGDADAMPVAMQIDYSDGYTRASRPRLLRATQDIFPSLLRYQRSCYAKAGRIVALSGGRIVKEWEDGVGVWQGGPLGNATFCLSIWDWMYALYCRLQPESALQPDSHGGWEVSIVCCHSYCLLSFVVVMWSISPRGCSVRRRVMVSQSRSTNGMPMHLATRVRDVRDLLLSFIFLGRWDARRHMTAFRDCSGLQSVLRNFARASAGVCFLWSRILDISFNKLDSLNMPWQNTTCFVGVLRCNCITFPGCFLRILFLASHPLTVMSYMRVISLFCSLTHLLISSAFRYRSQSTRVDCRLYVRMMC